MCLESNHWQRQPEIWAPSCVLTRWGSDLSAPTKLVRRTEPYWGGPAQAASIFLRRVHWRGRVPSARSPAAPDLGWRDCEASSRRLQESGPGARLELECLVFAHSSGGVESPSRARRPQGSQIPSSACCAAYARLWRNVAKSTPSPLAHASGSFRPRESWHVVIHVTRPPASPRRLVRGSRITPPPSRTRPLTPALSACGRGRQTSNAGRGLPARPGGSGPSRGPLAGRARQKNRPEKSSSRLHFHEISPASCRFTKQNPQAAPRSSRYPVSTVAPHRRAWRAEGAPRGATGPTQPDDRRGREERFVRLPAATHTPTKGTWDATNRATQGSTAAQTRRGCPHGTTQA